MRALPTMTNRQVKDITPKAWAEARRLKQRAAQLSAHLRQPASAGAWRDVYV